MADWYSVLQVPRQAANDAIKSAYRKLAKKYHPDAHPGDKECEARFKEITEAYTILSDPEKRRKYDEELEKAQAGGKKKEGTAGRQNNANAGAYAGMGQGKVDFQDISRSFERFFGFNAQTKEIINEEKLRPNANAGNPLDTTNLFEAFMGIKKKK